MPAKKTQPKKSVPFGVDLEADRKILGSGCEARCHFPDDLHQEAFFAARRELNHGDEYILLLRNLYQVHATRLKAQEQQAKELLAAIGEQEPRIVDIDEAAMESLKPLNSVSLCKGELAGVFEHLSPSGTRRYVIRGLCWQAGDTIEDTAPANELIPLLDWTGPTYEADSGMDGRIKYLTGHMGMVVAWDGEPYVLGEWVTFRHVQMTAEQVLAQREAARLNPRPLAKVKKAAPPPIALPGQMDLFGSAM